MTLPERVSRETFRPGWRPRIAAREFRELSGRISAPSFQEGARMFYQNYNPTGNVLLSTLLAAVPILVLLYFIALHPRRDSSGKKHLGVAAPYAAFAGVVAAFVISCVVFRMPGASA